MRAVSNYATAVVTAAMLAPWVGAHAQDTKLSVPNVTVTAPAAPVEPSYMRDPWKAYGRNPYFGRYRVEEDKFSEVPCTQTRIAFGPGGKCLQGYWLGLATNSTDRNSNPCDIRLDVVIATSGDCLSKRLSWPLTRTKSWDRFAAAVVLRSWLHGL